MKQLHTHNYGLIILAAGSSSRLGYPKQLIKFHNKSLLQHTVDEGNAATNNKVMVVTGANRDQLEVELLQLPVHVIYNENWEAGIASSIKSGVTALRKIFPDLYGIIISACDQPFVSSALFKKLVEQYKQGNKGIIASHYNDTLDVPILFGKKYFNALLQLKEQEDAKILLSLYADDIEKVEFDQGGININTIEDYEALLNSNKDVA
jgi:molybdenum cofactor cytidylyltransferase